MNIEKKINLKSLNREEDKGKQIVREHSGYINRKLLVDAIQEQRIKSVIEIFARFKREGELSKAIDNTDVSRFKDLLFQLIKAFNLIASENSSLNYIKEIFRSE